MIQRLSTFALIGLLSAGCATDPASPRHSAIDYSSPSSAAGAQAADADPNLQRFLSWFAGEYDNNEQVWQQAQDGVAEADRHEHIHHLFLPVDAPAFGPHAFFVRQYLGRDASKVYRHRLYQFSTEDDGRVRLAIHTFKDPEPYLNAQDNPQLLQDLTPDATRNVPGCDVFWRFETTPEPHYIGEMEPGACFYHSTRLNKNIYIEDTLKLTQEQIWIGDKGFDEDGNKLFGRDEQHVNRKVRYFKGWAGVRNDRFDPNAADPEAMAFVPDLRLHNEGQVVPLVTKDGVDTGYDVELARLTYQNTRTAVLKLALIERASGKTFTYTWTNPGAQRIGINLRWLQVGLTAEDLPAQ